MAIETTGKTYEVHSRSDSSGATLAGGDFAKAETDSLEQAQEIAAEIGGWVVRRSDGAFLSVDPQTGNNAWKMDDEQ